MYFSANLCQKEKAVVIKSGSVLHFVVMCIGLFISCAFFTSPFLKVLEVQYCKVKYKGYNKNITSTR